MSSIYVCQFVRCRQNAGVLGWRSWQVGSLACHPPGAVGGDTSLVTPSTVLVRSGPAAVVQTSDGAPERLRHHARVKLRVLGRVGSVLGLRTRGLAGVEHGALAAAPHCVHVARLELRAALARALALGLERRLAALAQARFHYLTRARARARLG